MKRVAIGANKTEVNLCDIADHIPIFAKRSNKLEGMVIQEDGRWILRLGGQSGATGWHDTRKECLLSCLQYHYDFFVA